jgi:hypothetical protein
MSANLHDRDVEIDDSVYCPSVRNGSKPARQGARLVRESSEEIYAQCILANHQERIHCNGVVQLPDWTRDFAEQNFQSPGYGLEVLPYRVVSFPMLLIIQPGHFNPVIHNDCR